MTEAISLRSDSLEAVLLPELGARLHSLRAFGHDLIRTPDDPATHARDPFFWGAYPMAPWCNRAPAGRSAVAGRSIELTPNFGDGSAIHGLVSSRSWLVRADGSFEVDWAGRGTGWPWAFALYLAAALEREALTLEYRLVNRSDAPMPAGLGVHPWFRRPLEVRIPADAVYETNTASTAESRPVGGPFDLRSPTEPAPGLDATWSGLREPIVELGWPALGVRARIEAESWATSAGSGGILVALANPDALDAIAVEPQTHGPDPIRRLVEREPDAPLLLPAGGELGLRLTFRLGLARDARGHSEYGPARV